MATATTMSAFAQTTQLPDTVLSVLSRSQTVGVPSPSQTVYLTMGLKPRHPAEFQAFVDSVSNPRLPTYRQWMTPEQVAQQFGPSATTVTTIVNYLRSKGLTITLQGRTNLGISAKGTVTQVQNAFNTTLKNYTGPDRLGRTVNFMANATALRVPSAWAPQVQAVAGLENWSRPHAWSTQTLTPPLIRGLYNTAPAYAGGFRGQGQTIGITNFDGFALSNVPLYITAFGLPVPAGGAGSNIQVVTLEGGAQNGGAGGEGDLDIQMEIGTAPLANIIIYDDGAGDELTVLNRESSDNQAQCISESYGFILSPSGGMAAHNFHLAMGAQGQTIMNATGDAGTDIQSFPYPDAEPEALGVGGTVATVDSNSGVRIDEVAWDGGGGGWTLSGFPFDRRPSWQVGPGVPASPNFRLQPDVALQAGGPGAVIIYFGGAQTGIDGTSVASPMNCGCLAIVEQLLQNSGAAPRLGRVADALYLLGGNSSVFFDVTVGSNGSLPDGSTSSARVNWDFCTGWGAPNFNGLFNALLQVTTATPYFPDAVTTAVGSYILGDPSSVAASDGIYYQVGSAGIPQFGQAAGVFAQWFIPDNSVAITIDIQTNGGIVGGTNMVWLWNWVTNTYDLIGSKPLDAGGSNDKVITVRPADVPLYLGPGGEVDAIVRGHFPIKPFNNQVPLPFTYKIDMLELLVR